MKKKEKKVVDQFNQLCSCKHQADEHLCGEGPCFKCDCSMLKPIEELTVVS